MKVTPKNISDWLSQIEKLEQTFKTSKRRISGGDRKASFVEIDHFLNQ